MATIFRDDQNGRVLVKLIRCGPSDHYFSFKSSSSSSIRYVIYKKKKTLKNKVRNEETNEWQKQNARTGFEPETSRSTTATTTTTTTTTTNNNNNYKYYYYY